MKLRQNTKGNYSVCLPKDLVDLIGWQKGIQLAVVTGKDCLEIRKV